MGRGMKVISPWFCCGVIESQVCFDSGLYLVCVVGSAVSHLPLNNTTQILCGVQVRPVSWPSNTMVSTPVTSSFGSVGGAKITKLSGCSNNCNTTTDLQLGELHSIALSKVLNMLPGKGLWREVWPKGHPRVL